MCSIQATQRSNDAQQSSATRFIPVFHPDWKTTAIRLIAVWKTSVSRHHGGKNWQPLKPRKSQNYFIKGYKGDPFKGSPLCRETLVSLTAVSLIAVVFSSLALHVGWRCILARSSSLFPVFEISLNSFIIFPQVMADYKKYYFYKK